MLNNNLPILSMAEFTPAKEQLTQIVADLKKVDHKDVPAVHDARMKLRDLRVGVTKKGKELREGAITFQKEVLAKERELVAIIEPEEDVLEKIEAEAKLRKEMETRRNELPTRIEALKSIGDNVAASDDELLAMDDDEFNAYRVRRIDAKLIKDKADFEDKKRKDEEDARIKALQEDKERREKLAAEEAESKKQRDAEAAKLAAERTELDKEKARLEGEKKAREEAEAEKQREIERQEREAKLKKEQEDAAALKAKQEQEDRDKEANYQKWLADSKFDETTDVVQWKNGIAYLYRKISEYNPKSNA